MFLFVFLLCAFFQDDSWRPFKEDLFDASKYRESELGPRKGESGGGFKIAPFDELPEDLDLKSLKVIEFDSPDFGKCVPLLGFVLREFKVSTKGQLVREEYLIMKLGEKEYRKYLLETSSYPPADIDNIEDRIPAVPDPIELVVFCLVVFFMLLSKKRK